MHANLHLFNSIEYQPCLVENSTKTKNSYSGNSYIWLPTFE